MFLIGLAYLSASVLFMRDGSMDWGLILSNEGIASIFGTTSRLQSAKMSFLLRVTGISLKDRARRGSSK